jgi:hypothetical protein
VHESKCYSNDVIIQVFREFERRFKKDGVDRFKRFWTVERIEKFLALAKKRKEAECYVSQIGSVSTVDVARE